MNKQISARCGKGTCEFYDKHNKISGCKKFEDRKDCPLSMEQRRKTTNKSRSKGDAINWYGC